MYEKLLEVQEALRAAHIMLRVFANRTGEHRGIAAFEEMYEKALEWAGCFGEAE